MAAKKTKEQAIQDAIKVHGNKYDYSLVDYKNCYTKVKIICKEHGIFEITLTNHITTDGDKHLASGCPKCGLLTRASKRTKPFSDFLSEAKEVHGDKFQYIESSYVGRRSKMEMICPNHGNFWQSPQKHLAGQQCPKCSGKILITSEEFIKRSILKHKDTYDYSLIKPESFINCNTDNLKVEIICKTHGTFLQRVRSHLNGCGCRACMCNGFNIAKDGTLYVLFANPDIVKVGITNRDLQVRLKEINKNNIYTFKPMYFKLFNGLDALSKETEVLRFFKSQLNPVESVFDGSTECFHAGKYSIDALVAFVRNMV